jgi:hypothetical protein
LRDLGFSHLALGIASEPRDKALASFESARVAGQQVTLKMGPLSPAISQLNESHAARSSNGIDAATELSGKSLIP